MEALELILLNDTVQFPCQMQLSCALDCARQIAKWLTETLLCRNYVELKQMMHQAPEVVHAFLDHLVEALITYVCYQIDSGAQASIHC